MANPHWSGVGAFSIQTDAQDPNSFRFGALIDGGLHGGFGSVEQSAFSVATSAQIGMPSPTGTLSQFTGSWFNDPIDIAKGNYLYSHDDISVGSGAFPGSLTFTRLYSSGLRTQKGALGLGWSHGYDITAKKGSDGLQAFGEDSALDAASSIAEIVVAIDILRDPAKPLKNIAIAALGARWLGDQLIGNTVIVKQGLNGEVFVKLPDGTYNPPQGNSAKLTLNGDGSYTYETADRTQLAFNPPTSTNGASKITTYTLKSGVQARFTYAGNDLTRVENSFGRSLDIHHLGSGEIEWVGEAGGRTVSFEYTANDLTKFYDATQQSTRFTYDLPGRMVSIFYPSRSGPFMVNGYDGLGRVQTQLNANNKPYTYYFAGSRSEELDPAGNSKISYFDVDAHILRAIDQVGRVTTTDYDDAGRPVLTTLPEGNSVAYTYDDTPCSAPEKRCTHNVKTTTKQAKPGSPLLPLVTTFWYEDSFNKVSSVQTPRGAASTPQFKTDFTYDPAHGQVKTVTGAPDADGARPLTTYSYTSYTQGSTYPPFYLLTRTESKIDDVSNAVTATAYNTSNRYVPLSKTVDPDGLNLTTQFVYDSVGNLKAVDGPRTDIYDLIQYAYDDERRLTQVTDALGKATRIAYDPDGRQIRKSAQNGSLWMTNCTRYTATGKVQRSWGPGTTNSDQDCPAEVVPVSVTDTTYDDLDRVKTVTQLLTAEQGGNRETDTNYFDDGRVQSVVEGVGTPAPRVAATYSYTPNGLPATLLDARNYLGRYEYDGHDRRYRAYQPSPNNSGVSSTTDYEQYLYDENGNVTSLRRRNGKTITMVYDPLDRLIKRQYPVPDTADNLHFGYDLLGRRIFADLDDGSHNVDFHWDHAGRLADTVAGGRKLSYQYDQAGNRTRITWPDESFYVTTNYDELQRPKTIRELGSTVLGDFANYDDLSRRRTVLRANGTATGYNYDNQGMLYYFSQDFAGTDKDIAFSYVRNQAQEIISHSWNNDAYQGQPMANGTRGYTANGLNQYTNVAGATIGYDLNGNVQSDGTWTWSYDNDNQLRSVAKAGVSESLAYDAIGRLREEKSNGTVTQFLYDGSDLVAEYDGAGNLLQRYVHGPGVDEPLVAYSGPSTTSKQWLYGDHLGSVIATADSTGNNTVIYTYGPFGEPNQGAGMRFRYTGQTLFPNLAMYYYKARFYSQTIGRFMQTDPSGQQDDLNLYAYVGNSPTNKSDPTGLRPPTVGEIAFLKPVYNAKVDFGKIDIKSGTSLDPRSWPPIATGAAVTLENTIHFPSSGYTDDFSKAGLSSQAWLVHEVAHVYQYQNNPSYSWVKAAAEGTRSDTYQYSLDPNKSFLDYRFEQQAAILADYFVAKTRNSDNVGKFESVLAPMGLGSTGSSNQPPSTQAAGGK